MKMRNLGLTILTAGMLFACSDEKAANDGDTATTGTSETKQQMSAVPTVSAGRVEVITGFRSDEIGPRTVHIWLPHGYDEHKAYSVIYMHDGQMLFDANGTWNNQEWGVDELVTELMQNGRIEDLMVVGVFNAGQLRHKEYFPEKAYYLLPREKQESLYGFESDQLMADEYLRFLVKELKPYIDRNYATRPDAAHTAVMGSSMGGLISLYAISEYPDVFGSAAALSTHWPGVEPDEMDGVPEAFLAYLNKKLPDPRNHKIYFDHGDQTLDAHYPPLQKKVDALMVEKGFTAENWTTVVAPGAAHDEKAWRDRLPGALTFLFGK
ncbi:alpha/beta hydrolase [Kordiimonas sp.]|uniref:alpha/beta hydrolase n=1 Tax=Kordiimonas sp. TaxID=1970157 RepID=UPI003A9064A6